MKSEHCFICNEGSPNGFQIRFERDGDGAVARYRCDETYTGWIAGVQHDGVTSALMDEVCGFIPHSMGLASVTAELSVCYKNPIRVGEEIELRSKPIRMTRRLMDIEAAIQNDAGELKATATAKMFLLSERQVEAMGLV